MRTSHFSDQEKGRLYALGGENVEDLVGITRDWTIVEGSAARTLDIESRDLWPKKIVLTIPKTTKRSLA